MGLQLPGAMTVEDLERRRLGEALAVLHPEELERLGVSPLMAVRYPDDPVKQSCYTQVVYLGRTPAEVARKMNLAPAELRGWAEGEAWLEDRKKLLEGERDAAAHLLGRYCAMATIPYVTSIERARVKAQEILEGCLARADEKGISPMSLSHLTKALKDVTEIGRALLELGNPSLRPGSKAATDGGGNNGDKPVVVNVAVLQSASGAVASIKPDATSSPSGAPSAAAGRPPPAAPGDVVDVAVSACAPPVMKAPPGFQLSGRFAKPGPCPPPVGRRGED